jgi:hypothetical protein
MSPRRTGRPSFSSRWQAADEPARKDAFRATMTGRPVRDPAHAELAADAARSRRLSFSVLMVLAGLALFFGFDDGIESWLDVVQAILAGISLLLVVWFWRSERINRRIARASSDPRPE